MSEIARNQKNTDKPSGDNAESIVGQIRSFLTGAREQRNVVFLTDNRIRAQRRKIKGLGENNLKDNPN